MGSNEACPGLQNWEGEERGWSHASQLASNQTTANRCTTTHLVCTRLRSAVPHKSPSTPPEYGERLSWRTRILERPVTTMTDPTGPNWGSTNHRGTAVSGTDGTDPEPRGGTRRTATATALQPQARSSNPPHEQVSAGKKLPDPWSHHWHCPAAGERQVEQSMQW